MRNDIKNKSKIIRCGSIEFEIQNPHKLKLALNKLFSSVLVLTLIHSKLNCQLTADIPILIELNKKMVNLRSNSQACDEEKDNLLRSYISVGFKIKIHKFLCKKSGSGLQFQSLHFLNKSNTIK